MVSKYLQECKNLLPGDIFTEIFNSFPGMFCVAGEDGEIYEVNQRLLDMFGYQKSEISGKHVSILFPGSFSKKLGSTINDARDKGQASLIVDAVGKTGGKFTSLLTIYTVHCSQRDMNCVVFFMRDVNEYTAVETESGAGGFFEDELATRLRYEEGLAACSQSLLSDHDGAIEEALHHLLQASGVSRIYIFENFNDTKDDLCSRQVHEVCAPGVTPQIDNPLLQHATYSHGYGRWQEELSSNRPITSLVESLPRSEQQLLLRQGILSILILPVWVRGEWYGFIGFDDIVERRVWDEKEVKLLRTASHMIGSCMARKKTDEDLRNSEYRFRELFDNMRCGVAVYSAVDDGEDFIFRDFNKAGEKIEGVSKEELIGRKVTEAFPSIRETGLLDVLRQVWKSGKPVHHPASRFEGLKSTGFRENYVYRLQTGDVVAVYEDVTERKEMQDEIKSSFEHYAAIVNSAEAIIMEVDTNGRLVFTNSVAMKMLGNGQANLRGRSIAETFSGEFAKILESSTSRVFELGLAQQYESILRLTAESMEALVNLVPIYGNEGTVETVMINIRDISDLKTAERLRLENLALEKSNILKTEFLASMSHELRTPLNSIIGYSEILHDQMFGQLNEKQKRQMEIIRINGKALLALINDILDLSKIEAGKIELKQDLIPIADIISDVEISVIPMIKKKGQRLETDVNNGMMVWADMLRVKQCLNNLVSNAVKFTSEGGLIRICAEGKGDLVVVSVQDNGIGIPPEKMTAIFQPFYRVDGSTTAEVGGTGLGLTITRMLVDAMGGDIWVKSDEHEGSTFYFTLPAEEAKKRDNLITDEKFVKDTY